ncbi:hypothetical protein KC721_01065 [Candidatus Woesebacteria bacterium]|nr:hypothetical protein [Candidatus Woesebacteria bacterium]
MFIPIWIIVIAVVIFYYWSKSNQSNIQTNSSEYFEEIASRYKEYLFELAHFDSPRIIDLQDKHLVMEINYLRLKQRISHNEEKKIEIARDWASYVQSLNELKSARVLLDVDMSESAYENFEEASKEPYIITEEVEKKFKSLLGKDFQKLLPNYDERQKKAKKSGKSKSPFFLDWKIFYSNSPSYQRLIELKDKEKSSKE